MKQGCAGCNPEGMGHVKMTEYVLVHFYITTLTLLYSLRLQGGGSYSPPKSTTACTR